MLPKDTQIFVSYHPSEASRVLSVLEQIKASGWGNIIAPETHAAAASISEQIRQSGMFVVFLSKAYAQTDGLMLEEFAYASTIVRKPFLSVCLDGLAEIRQDCESALTTLSGTERVNKRQLLAALEMLTAKHPGTTADALADALAKFAPDTPPYAPSTPQICEKPCEAYEGDEPYIFISYAHDDATRVYPIVKQLFESGRDLWYDEGIKTTERYLPVIADHVKRSAVFVLMLTNRCLARPFVMNYEWESARQRGIPIVPVLLEELTPPAYASEIAAQLKKTAIAPDALLEHIASFKNLPNRGTRVAVPPAIKQNVVYDVVLPPELPGFEIAVHEGEVVIIKYVGSGREATVPATVSVPGGGVTFKVAIGPLAFAGSRLTSIFISEGVTNTGKATFNACELLSNITLPESLKNIGAAAFCGCASLTNIKIPKGVTSIDGNPFWGCASLTSINVDIENNTYASKEGVLFDKNLTTLIKYPSAITTKSYSIVGSVTDIGSGAFRGCKSLTSVIIPEGVTSIGPDAFEGCELLTSITLPNSLNSIADGAFARCVALTNITIPKGVTSIGKNAFYGCKSLASHCCPIKSTCGFRNYLNYNK